VKNPGIIGVIWACQAKRHFLAFLLILGENGKYQNNTKTLEKCTL
jgi:hypothetical protein